MSRITLTPRPPSLNRSSGARASVANEYEQEVDIKHNLLFGLAGNVPRIDTRRNPGEPNG
ncbi:hypothetical protein SBV1_2830002 [Verrucomicrobia bacterium]|nr:hypothetical protein SBV1_2830002 [Verrucomicrobiota bacterium]